MELEERFCQLKERAINLKDNLKTEEATKNALVLPFLSALGYDVFNPLEVIPEYIADSRLKKDEKVDYAILQDGKPIILIECKKVENDKLDVKKHAGQLFKYFTASKARFIILTNGIVYKFFTDIEETNILDKDPFFTFNLLEYKNNHLETLGEFCKENFDIEKAYSNAGDLKYIKQFEEVIENEYRNPSDDFVKYLINKSNLFEGRITDKVIEKHKTTTVEAFNLFMSKVMKTSLDFSLAAKAEEKEEEQEIVTTLEELEGFAIVKSLLNGFIDLTRVTYRDNASYFNVLLDDNIRKTICRLYFNTSQKYIALMPQGKEQKKPIKNLEAIYGFADDLRHRIEEITGSYANK